MNNQHEKPHEVSPQQVPTSEALEQISNKEGLPTKENIMEVIKSILKKVTAGKEVKGINDKQEGAGSKEIIITFKREKSDDEGLYLFEVTIPGEPEGEFIEYTYTRKGEFPNKIARGTTGIDVAYYDVSGAPYGGNSVAELKDGVWVIN